MKHIEATKLALDAETSIEKARKTLSGLCDGTTRWTMSVPARPDEDPDLIIAAAFRDAGAAITALREALAEQPSPPPECQTEAEKTAYAFGWFKALESVREKPAQQEPVAKPYAYEYGRDNGDSTYSVVIEKGDLVQTAPAVYNYVRPRNAHKDWPIKELFDHPPAQRTWVGLTDEEELQLAGIMDKSRHWLVAAVEAKLKEKNNGN